MNLGDMAQNICSKLGLFDATSLIRCKEYIKNRYQMIYDAELWSDTLTLVSNSSLQAGINVIDFPANIDRIVSIRSAGNRLIQPVNSAYVMEMNPLTFENTGEPVAYEDYTDSFIGATGSGSSSGGTGSSLVSVAYRKIRFFPIPTVDTALLILGKRILVPLSADTDYSVIRNSDNCLLSYAMSDMLERQRQYAKAQAKATEAGAMLQLMRDIENKQSAKQAMVVPEVDPYPYDCSDWLVSK